MSCLSVSSAHDSAPYDLAVELRLLDPGDGETVLQVFEGLGDRSRALRFLTAKPRLTAADLRQLTAVDQRDHVAVVAHSTLDGRAVGIARFVRDADDPGSADVAVAVVDAWQGIGLGTMLTQDLVERALALGVHRFTMAMSSQNEAAVRLLHRTPGEIERLSIDEQLAEFAIEVGRRPVQPWPRLGAGLRAGLRR
ncbi:MAG: GNAT family N-acetyltransferase [Nocardioides sp.]